MDKTKIYLALALIATFSLFGIMIYYIVEIFIIDILIGIICLMIIITFFIIMYYPIKRSNKKDKEFYDNIIKEAENRIKRINR